MPEVKWIAPMSDEATAVAGGAPLRGIEQRRERDRLDPTGHALDGADDDDGAEVLEPAGRRGHGIEERVLDDRAPSAAAVLTRCSKKGPR